MQEPSVAELLDRFHAEIADVVEGRSTTERQVVLDQFISAVGELGDPVEELASGIRALADGTTDRHGWMWLVAAYHHPSPRYREDLCRILERDAGPFEAAVELLQLLPDPRNVLSLVSALRLEPSDGPSNSLGVKILEALDDIGDERAGRASRGRGVGTRFAEI